MEIEITALLERMPEYISTSNTTSLNPNSMSPWGNEPIFLLVNGEQIPIFIKGMTVNQNAGEDMRSNIICDEADDLDIEALTRLSVVPELEKDNVDWKKEIEE